MSDEGDRDSAASPASAEREAIPLCGVWLLDGYNVLHASLGGQERTEWWKAPQRERIVERVSKLPAHFDQMWIVFDGDRPMPEPTEPTRVRCVFARSADEWIRAAIRDAQSPHEIGVVSGDRQVCDRARGRGAKVVSPRTFLRHCEA